MSFQNVAVVGNEIFFVVVITKAEGQDRVPATVNATVALAHDGALIDPAPTPTVTVDEAGVATVKFSHAVDRDNDLAGRWDYGVVTDGDLIAAYDSTFFMDASPVLDAS